MAKIIPGIIGISGTLVDHVFVKGKGNKRYIRRKQQPGLGKSRPAIVKQNSRTGFLNSISGGINRIIKGHNGIFHQGNFYDRMNKRLRAEAMDNRFLLLLTLKNIEVNTEHPLENIYASSLTVTGKDSSIAVKLQVLTHAKPGEYKATCYDYELVLLSWDKTEAAPVAEIQLSPWVFMKDAKPTILFNFKRREDITHWVVFLRRRLGITIEGFGQQYVAAKVAEGMQLVEVGSFDEDELRLLAEKQRALAAIKPAVRQIDHKERTGVISYASNEGESPDI